MTGGILLIIYKATMSKPSFNYIRYMVNRQLIAILQKM
jgi:hypothetical protein